MNPCKAIRVFGLILSLGATALLFGPCGCATGGRYAQSTDERIDDRNTTSHVKAALARDTRFIYDGVHVETFNGTVHLSGYVASMEQKDRAGNLARIVTEVRGVVNNIRINEPAN